MQEQFDEKLKEIEENQFTTTKEKLGYAEEFIIVKSEKPDENFLLNYSLSNSLEDIKLAILRRTGQEINIEKANWTINPDISIDVKYLMKKHNVIYSMTIYYENDIRVASVHMQVGEKWLNTRYAELKEGNFYPLDYYETLVEVKRVLNIFIDKYKIEGDKEE